MTRPVLSVTPELSVPLGPEVGSAPDATNGPAIVKAMGMVEVAVPPGLVPWRTPAPLDSSIRTGPVPASVENLIVFPADCQSRVLVRLESPNGPPLNLTTAGAAVGELLVVIGR